MPRYYQLKLFEREFIEDALQKGLSQTKIALSLKRSRSTIKREIDRNSFHTKDNTFRYHAIMAHYRAKIRKERNYRGFTSPNFSFGIFFNAKDSGHNHSFRKLFQYCAQEYYWKKISGSIILYQDKRKYCAYFHNSLLNVYSRAFRRKYPSVYRYKPEGFLKRNRRRRLRRFLRQALGHQVLRKSDKKRFRITGRIPIWTRRYSRKRVSNKTKPGLRAYFPYLWSYKTLPPPPAPLPQAQPSIKVPAQSSSFSRLRKPYSRESHQQNFVQQGKTMSGAEQFRLFRKKRALVFKGEDCLF